MIDLGVGMLAWWQAVLAALVAIIGAARLTRVVTYDAFPPAVWLRETVDRRLGDKWGLLTRCSWCFGYWAFVLAVGSFVGSFLHPALGWTWWLIWGTLAGGYLVSMWVYWDEGKPDD